jgi:hypothetical protein
VKSVAVNVGAIDVVVVVVGDGLGPGTLLISVCVGAMGQE